MPAEQIANQDVTPLPRRQAITTAAMGCMAALDAKNFLGIGDANC